MRRWCSRRRARTLAARRRRARCPRWAPTASLPPDRDRDPVADGGDGRAQAGIGQQAGVELGLVLDARAGPAAGRTRHGAAHERVVDEQQPAGAQQLEAALDVLVVAELRTVDEREVERRLERAQAGRGVLEPEVDPVADARL